MKKGYQKLYTSNQFVKCLKTIYGILIKNGLKFGKNFNPLKAVRRGIEPLLPG